MKEYVTSNRNETDNHTGKEFKCEMGGGGGQQNMCTVAYARVYEVGGGWVASDPAYINKPTANDGDDLPSFGHTASGY
jgi:hypothetical protein